MSTATLAAQPDSVNPNGNDADIRPIAAAPAHAPDIDAHAEDIPPRNGSATSVALAPRERRHEVIRPLDTGQLVDSFQAYQALLPRLLSDGDYQAAGDKKFVKKSGWRKIATAFDLDVIRISEHVDRDEQGNPVRVEAVYRAIAPSGRVMDGDGYCSVEEERFGKANDSDWQRAKKRAKLENDLRATASTRAKNRAISDLVGMGEVSAEEITHDEPAAAAPVPEPAPEPRIQPNEVGQLAEAIVRLTGADRDRDKQILKNLYVALCGNEKTPTVAVAMAILRVEGAMGLVADAATAPPPATDQPQAA